MRDFSVINDSDGYLGCPVGWIMCYYHCNQEDLRSICDTAGNTHYDGTGCTLPRADRPPNAHIGGPEMWK